MLSTEIIESPVDVRNTLAPLGLTPEPLRHAVLFGETARDTVSPHDPCILPGVLAWARTHRALADHYVPLGWKMQEPNNLPMIVNPTGEIAVTVQQAVRLDGRAPALKKPMGRMKTGIVLRNEEQLAFLDPITMEPKPHGAMPGCITWFLLWQRFSFRKEDKILIQVGLPARASEDGNFAGWFQRIILEPIVMAPEPDLGGSSDNEVGNGIVIDVSRRHQ